MKVIVCGSRSWRDRRAIYARLSELPAGSEVVHGQSPSGGADALADAAARDLGHTPIAVPINAEDRRRAGKTRRAPIFRNLRMLDEHPDVELVLAFWDGSSPGTKQMIDESRRRGISVEVTVAEVLARHE